MNTETELRSVLCSRAADAPVVDPDQLLAALTVEAPAVRSTGGMTHGRRWAVAGVAAGFAALAIGSGLAVGGGHRPGPAAEAGTASVAAPAAPAPVSTGPVPSPSTSPSTSSTVNPYDPAVPAPLDTDWLDADVPGAAPYDPTAIVFSDDPIVASYVRPHQQLSILPGGGTRKDSSDAPWHTAVQVYLPGSGFDPASIGDPTPVTVNGVDRRFGTLPKLLDVAGPAQVPSLLWQVDGAWVVLQISTPAVPTADQLAAAAARMDVHRGKS